MTQIWIVRFGGDVAIATSLAGAKLAALTLRDDHNGDGYPAGAEASIVGPIARQEDDR